VLRLLVAPSAQVQAEVKASDLKKGQKIALSQGGHIKGVQGTKAPFGNMSAGAKKFLGLPNIPAIPNIPEIPKIPKVPQIPNAPGLKGTGGGGGAPPEIGNLEEGEAEQGRGSEPEVPEIPTQAQTGGLAPETLSSATPEPETSESSDDFVSKQILQLKKTSSGVEVMLEGDEKISLSSEEKVMQVLTLQDLRKDMSVHLEVSEQDGENIVQRITVLG